MKKSRITTLKTVTVRTLLFSLLWFGESLAFTKVCAKFAGSMSAGYVFAYAVWVMAILVPTYFACDFWITHMEKLSTKARKYLPITAQFAGLALFVPFVFIIEKIFGL